MMTYALQSGEIVLRQIVHESGGSVVVLGIRMFTCLPREFRMLGNEYGSYNRR